MTIATKTGDAGQTSLFSGERVWKDNERVETYGTIDELSSAMGFVKHFLPPEEKGILESFQEELIAVAAEIAAEGPVTFTPRRPYCLSRLDELVGRYEKGLSLSGFVLPGGTQAAGGLDLCRTVARRAERHLVRLAREKPVADALRQYLNRLSDVLYLMARSLEKRGL